MAITQRIQPISNYPKLGDAHEIFRQKADIAWRDLATAIPQINVWTNQVNGLAASLNQYENTTLSYMNSTQQYKNQAYAYKVDAESARNEIRGYVIPTNATLSTDELEARFDEIVRTQVAQQIIISYLQNK